MPPHSLVPSPLSITAEPDISPSVEISGSAYLTSPPSSCCSLQRRRIHQQQLFCAEHKRRVSRAARLQTKLTAMTSHRHRRHSPSSPSPCSPHLLSLYLLCFVSCCPVLCLAASSHFASSLTFQIEPRLDQCFYEELQQGDTFTMEFEVVRGGLLDIRLRVSDPSGALLIEKMAFFNRNVSAPTQPTAAASPCTLPCSHGLTGRAAALCSGRRHE